MKLRELRTGQHFLFTYANVWTVYEYRGNGWYGTPAGYDGGPWYSEADPAVVVVSAEDAKVLAPVGRGGDGREGA